MEISYSAGHALPTRPALLFGTNQEAVSSVDLTDTKNMTFSAMVLGSIHTCDLLGVNYLLNKGLYCTKWLYSHLLFGQCLPGLRSSIMGVYPFLRLYGLNSSVNSSRLMNFRCEWTLSTAAQYNDRYIETKFWFSSHSTSNFLICAF